MMHSSGAETVLYDFFTRALGEKFIQYCDIFQSIMCREGFMKMGAYKVTQLRFMKRDYKCVRDVKATLRKVLITIDVTCA